ncbi:MAG: FAD/NAD(P)-binding protein [Acidobacteriaceae bacterium]|nr:FAD/NAD(P)-binding protein [Acidobacteriaceae bacterium]
MSETDCCNQEFRGFTWLIGELDKRSGLLDERIVRELLEAAHLDVREVTPYVERRADSYARRCVARRENYEILVLTWSASQGSVAHDHSGSLCGLKVIEGELTEQLFSESADGRVRSTTHSRVGAEQILVDPGVVVHSLMNDSSAGKVLVTVHIYSPPLPEVRRYAVAEDPVPKLFLRPARPDAKVIAIIGGGVTGVMTMANLLRFAGENRTPLRVVLFDRQPAIGEGIAYRTNDGRHLLNVPASRMSAWPDKPEDFLAFARSKDHSTGEGDFLPRKIYGEYVRKTLLELAESAGDHLSAAIVHDEVTRLERSGSSGWDVETARRRSVHADLAILAVGHRPPNDPLASSWAGPRTRFVADPWAALVLSQIGPDEPVLLIGTGLTAVDVALTLNRPDRRAPIIALSRRGLLPMAHMRRPVRAADMSELLNRWLDPSEALTVRRLISELREKMAAREPGVEWQDLFDGLRPAIGQLWGRLELKERARFLRHARPYWEVHRHRMAPAIADTIERMRAANLLQIAAGTLISAAADAEGIDVSFACRGGSAQKPVRVAWVVNCTGPGVHAPHSTHPFLRRLLDAGTLCGDPLGLGLLTDAQGRGVKASGGVQNDLLIAGTLRKATLWDSTAVPELRQQAQTVARMALLTLSGASLPDPVRLTSSLPHLASGLG